MKENIKVVKVKDIDRIGTNVLHKSDINGFIEDYIFSNYFLFDINASSKNHPQSWDEKILEKILHLFPEKRQMIDWNEIYITQICGRLSCFIKFVEKNRSLFDITYIVMNSSLDELRILENHKVYLWFDEDPEESRSQYNDCVSKYGKIDLKYIRRHKDYLNPNDIIPRLIFQGNESDSLNNVEPNFLNLLKSNRKILITEEEVEELYDYFGGINNIFYQVDQQLSILSLHSFIETHLDEVKETIWYEVFTKYNKIDYEGRYSHVDYYDFRSFINKNSDKVPYGLFANLMYHFQADIASVVKTNKISYTQMKCVIQKLVWDENDKTELKLVEKFLLENLKFLDLNYFPHQLIINRLPFLFRIKVKWLKLFS